MARQISPDFNKQSEGMDPNFYVKSVRAFNNIQMLINEAEKKENIPVLMANIARLNDLAVHFMQKASFLSGRLKYYQEMCVAAQIENADLMEENLLLVSQIKGREPYLRAKEMLDEYMKKI